MKHIKESGTTISGMNLAPLIDVVLTLVVILLITMPALNIPNMPVDLPEAVTEDTKEKNIAVSLGREGKVSVNAEIINPVDLVLKVRKLLATDKNALVIIRADKECFYTEVQKLLELLKGRAGARRVAVATKQVTAREYMKK